MEEAQVTYWMKEENLAAVVKHPGSYFVLRVSEVGCVDILRNKVDSIKGLCDWSSSRYETHQDEIFSSHSKIPALKQGVSVLMRL